MVKWPIKDSHPKSLIHCTLLDASLAPGGNEKHWVPLKMEVSTSEWETVGASEIGLLNICVLWSPAWPRPPPSSSVRWQRFRGHECWTKYSFQNFQCRYFLPVCSVNKQGAEKYQKQDGQHLPSSCHYLKTFKPSAEATFVNAVIY